MERYTRGINQTRRRAHKPSFPIIKVGSRASVANRPETACSKAHGETSVLLNFTDFPSPLYRFIYYRPVARIISISVKQRPIVDAIYDRFTWTPLLSLSHSSSSTDPPRFFNRFSSSQTLEQQAWKKTMNRESMNQNTVLHLIIYRVRSCRRYEEREW